MTPDLPHAARRLLASPDWQALKPALLAYAGREPADGGATRSCGRYDVIAYVEWIAGQQTPPGPLSKQAGKMRIKA